MVAPRSQSPGRYTEPFRTDSLITFLNYLLGSSVFSEWDSSSNEPIPDTSIMKFEEDAAPRGFQTHVTGASAVSG